MLLVSASERQTYGSEVRLHKASTSRDSWPLASCLRCSPSGSIGLRFPTEDRSPFWRGGAGGGAAPLPVRIVCFPSKSLLLSRNRELRSGLATQTVSLAQPSSAASANGRIALPKLIVYDFGSRRLPQLLHFAASLQDPIVAKPCVVDLLSEHPSLSGPSCFCLTSSRTRYRCQTGLDTTSRQLSTRFASYVHQTDSLERLRI